VGGIVALLITQFNFSISAGIGFIALFGICIQNGVIMISDIKANLKLGSPLEKATKEGVRSRIRPVIMTAAMAAIGLMPAGHESWNWFGITTSVGDCHYRRIDRSDFLCLVCLSSYCGSGI